MKEKSVGKILNLPNTLNPNPDTRLTTEASTSECNDLKTSPALIPNIFDHSEFPCKAEVSDIDRSDYLSRYIDILIRDVRTLSQSLQDREDMIEEKIECNIELQKILCELESESKEKKRNRMCQCKCLMF